MLLYPTVGSEVLVLERRGGIAALMETILTPLRVQLNLPHPLLISAPRRRVPSTNIHQVHTTNQPRRPHHRGIPAPPLPLQLRTKVLKGTRALQLNWCRSNISNPSRVLRAILTTSCCYGSSSRSLWAAPTPQNRWSLCAKRGGNNDWPPSSHVHKSNHA